MANGTFTEELTQGVMEDKTVRHYTVVSTPHTGTQKPMHNEVRKRITYITGITLL